MMKLKKKSKEGAEKIVRKDLYEVLGLYRSSTDQEIKSSYHKLSLNGLRSQHFWLHALSMQTCFIRTVTDWYAAYVASRVIGLPNRPHLVFVDGHCMAPLEETWKAMSSSLRYAKIFSGPVCFRHAILSPLGYETVLFKGLTENIDCHGGSAYDLWQQPDERKTASISEFGEMIRASFGFPVDRHQTSKPDAGLNVLFIRHEDYLAHPRHAARYTVRSFGIMRNEKIAYYVTRQR